MTLETSNRGEIAHGELVAVFSTWIGSEVLVMGSEWIHRSAAKSLESLGGLEVAARVLTTWRTSHARQSAREMRRLELLHGVCPRSAPTEALSGKRVSLDGLLGVQASVGGGCTKRKETAGVSLDPSTGQSQRRLACPR